VVGLPVVNPDYREVTDAQSTTTHRADAARHTDGGPLCTPPSLAYCADNTHYQRKKPSLRHVAPRGRVRPRLCSGSISSSWSR